MTDAALKLCRAGNGGSTLFGSFCTFSFDSTGPVGTVRLDSTFVAVSGTTRLDYTGVADTFRLVKAGVAGTFCFDYAGVTDTFRLEYVGITVGFIII